MDRLHLVLLTETFLPEIGGGERQAQLLSRALVRRGHAVTIVTRRSQDGLPSDQIADGVRIIRVGPAGRGRWKKWGLALSAVRPLAGLRSSADVVLVSGFRIMGIAAIAVRTLFGKACVFKADSTGEMSGEFFRAGLARLGLTPRSAPVRPFLAGRNLLLRRADAFVAISNEIAMELVSAGVPAERIRRVPNGVDTNRFRPASAPERAALRQRLDLPDGPLVTYTGRLVSYKGLPLLLQVWADLCGAGRPGTLVLVGAGSADVHDCERDLHAFVHRHGLRGRVVFTGAVDGVEDYLRASDAFVFPTEDEAFGVSLVEAMACGLPSVASRVGGIPDIVEDGRTGLLVGPGSFAELREGLVTILEGGEAVAALGVAARRAATARFSEDVVADEYLRVFRALIDRRSMEEAA